MRSLPFFPRLTLPLPVALALTLAAGCGGGETASTTSSSGAGGCGAFPVPAWLADSKILVSGGTVENDDCRKGICRHNENTDLVRFHGDVYLVHRTAHSQVLGPNSALHIYKSTDSGITLQETAVILAPVDRDIRDPHFYVEGDTLFIKTLTRLPVNSTRDTNVDTIAMISSSPDGATWSDLAAITPATWSLWRIKESKGIFYSAAYEDGDKSVWLYTSPDGKVWTKGAQIYGVSADTPLETELTFLPSGKLLALVRMDGNDGEILGDTGRHRTKVCRADAPYSAFDCPTEISDQATRVTAPGVGVPRASITAGKITAKVLPLPSYDRTSIRPPAPCTMRWLMASPRPVPFSLVVKKGMKRFSSTFCEMPGPLSATLSSTKASSDAGPPERVPRPRRTRVETAILPRPFIACEALRTRFIST